MDRDKESLLLLTIACCLIFKTPLSTFLILGRVGVLNRTASWHWLTLPPTDSTAWNPHVAFAYTYNFIMPMTSDKLWLLPLIYTGASLIDSSVKGQYATYAFYSNQTQVILLLQVGIAKIRKKETKNKVLMRLKHMLPSASRKLISTYLGCYIKSAMKVWMVLQKSK